MSYIVVSPYTTPLECMTLEAAEAALSLLVAVGGFGQIVEVAEETPEVVAEAVVVPPKPRGRPRSK